MKTTKLSFEDTLPLTCSRSGNCCHGNVVRLNPWELFSLAKEKNITTRDFRNLYTLYGGIQLLFNGKKGWNEKEACSQYIENFGCGVHIGRPLACRLFPLGRQIQSNEVHYIFQGDQFPCVTGGCPEVLELPQLSVGDYLSGQETEQFEKGQDEYLELMQNLADMAFEFLLDTGLAESGDTRTLPLWLEMGNEQPEALAKRIGHEWIDLLMTPEMTEDSSDPIDFVQKHSELLQLKAQESFGAITTNHEFHEASVLMMGLALHLARGIGANPESLAELWCETATGFMENKESY